MEKYSIARQATDDCMANTHISCWIPKAIDTHSEYAILIPFHCNSGFTNAPQGCVIRTLPVSLPKTNLTLCYRRASNCRPPANWQPSLLPEVF